jgi:hypothetical protein
LSGNRAAYRTPRAEPHEWPVDRDLLFAESLAHPVNQLVEIRDELLDSHGRGGNPAIERLVRTALVPVDDHKTLFERGVEVPEQAHFGESRSSVEKDQERICDILATNHDPLIETAKTEVRNLRYAPGH